MSPVSNPCQSAVILTRFFSFPESRAIARYIANKWANQGTDLLGKTEKQRALAETWLEVEGQNYNPPISKIVYELVFKQWSKQEADPKVVEAESAKLEKVSSGRDERQPVRLAAATLQEWCG
jgi:glutathione S-transferase